MAGRQKPVRAFPAPSFAPAGALDPPFPLTHGYAVGWVLVAAAAANVAFRSAKARSFAERKATMRLKSVVC